MKRAKLLVVADDFTGGLDTGVQFAQRGIETRIVTEPIEDLSAQAEDCQVLVAVAETRALSLAEARETVLRIVDAGRRAGIPHFYKKTDSALRGNIGAELSAALEASGAVTLPFLPAFPRMRRVTKNGVHYIDGVPVSDSVFGKDPYNPVRQSRVPDLIAAQTDVPAGLWAPGAPLPPGVAVVDAETDADLLAAGSSLASQGALTVSAGCAGFAAALPRLLSIPEGPAPAPPDLGEGLIVVCGSVNPITRQQLDLAEGAGFPRIRLTPEQKLDPAWPETGAGRVSLRTWRELAQEHGCLILDANDPDDNPGEAERFASLRGWTPGEVRRRIPEALGGMLAGLLPGWRGALLITGGDTLVRCLERLGARELRPLLELFPGVVLSSVRIGDAQRHVISKSGGFGEEDLLLRLREKVREKA